MSVAVVVVSVTIVGRTGAIPVAVDVATSVVEVEVVVIVEVARREEDDEEDGDVDDVEDVEAVEVATVTTVVRCVEDEETATVKIWVIVVVTTEGFITPYIALAKALSSDSEKAYSQPQHIYNSVYNTLLPDYLHKQCLDNRNLK